MTSRLSDAEHAALAEAAAKANMSMHALAVEAVRNEVARRTQRDEVLAISSSVMEHHRDLLDRLSK
ncbi:MAG: hypothetical protein ABJH68_05900 [Ilumatobacter sp.]|uniref:hypothetical protein n=1 Tax=Ilumatobacter sp. TaxID=1967498 RepID=UPI003299FDDA